MTNELMGWEFNFAFMPYSMSPSGWHVMSDQFRRRSLVNDISIVTRNGLELFTGDRVGAFSIKLSINVQSKNLNRM